MISLGPLLGIEGDYQYSLVLLLPLDLEEKPLKLCLSFGGGKHELDVRACDTLRANRLYRCIIPIEKAPQPYEVTYRVIRDGQPLANTAGQSEWTFVVPGTDTLPKIGFASCNGSSSHFPSEMSNADYIMWDRLWDNHETDGLDYSFHGLLLCGDQIYADPIWERISYFKDHDLLGWRSTKKMSSHTVDPRDKADLIKEIENFYEDLYIASWSKAPVSRVLASIPSAMMWDDHDIIDGWGSYPKALQNCELFAAIFEVAKRYFELLQVRTRENASLISNTHYSQHISFRNYEILILDNRSFRRQDQIMSDEQYEDLRRINDSTLFGSCPVALEGQRVVLFAIPVPIAHLNYRRRVEEWLKWLVKGDFRKSLDDDALDHWDHHIHADEQRQLIDLIFNFGDTHSPKYVHVLSGDVHSAGAGRIKRTSGSERYVNQAVSSAIVHKPAGKIFQWFVDIVSTRKSRVKGYEVGLAEFGNEGKAPKTIYDRNVGFLYKAATKGLKYYLILERGKTAYEWKQPPQFAPDDAQ